MPSKKILLVYYTRTGNTEKVARAIEQIIECDTEKICEAIDRSGFFGFLRAGYDAMMNKQAPILPLVKDPKSYDLVILGTPVWAWKVSPPVRTYLTRYKDQIQQAAFFTVSEGTSPEGIVNQMEAIIGKRALALTGFTRKEIEDGTYLEKAREFAAKVK